MKKDSRYVWYIVDGFIFILINILVWYYFPLELTVTLAALSSYVIFILALGIWRLTDIITHEKVTDFMRAPFMIQKMEKGEEVWVSNEKGFKGFCALLVSCNACMGVWVSLIVFYLFAFFPEFTLAFMIIMMLSCFERFLSKLYNVLEKRG